MHIRVVCVALLAMLAMAALAPTAQATLTRFDSPVEEAAAGVFDRQQVAQAQYDKAVGLGAADSHPALQPPAQE